MATTKTTTKAPKKTAVKAEGLDAPIYSAAGASAGTIALPGAIFGLPWNADLVHQVVVSMQANARTPVAHTKDRSEVRGGGRKPWKQKGTGRARHGSSRSPIWVGGGVTHGPRADKSYAKKINRSMRRKALLVTLSQKLRDGEVIFVSDLGITEPKAAVAKKVLTGLTKVKGLERLMQKKVNGALLTTVGRDAAVSKSFGNFGNIVVEDIANINPVAILSAKFLIITDAQKAVEALEKRMSANA